MRIPIACSLDAASARSQVDEWRTLLGALVASVEWIAPTSLRLGLRLEGDSLTDLLSLAQREVSCCPFFRFAVEVDARGVALVVAVPEDAVSILQDFARLAQE
jgi:hypothetical protein